MKMKLFIIVAMISVLSCMIAFSVSAEGSASDEFGVAETLSGIPVDLSDTTSRVVLVGSDGLYRTFPSSYIYFKTGSGNWGWRKEAKLDFSHLNTALNLVGADAYTAECIVRIEVPDDVEYIEGFNGRENLRKFIFLRILR